MIQVPTTTMHANLAKRPRRNHAQPRETLYFLNSLGDADLVEVILTRLNADK